MTDKNTNKTERKKKGRPSMFSDELADKIISMIEDGLSERQIGKMDGMPSAFTIREWKDKNPGFLARSVRARELSAEKFREEALKIAQDVSDLADKIANRDPTDVMALTDFPKGYVDAKKLIVQELNREASLRDDSRFGDRKRVAVTGGDGGAVKVEAKVELSNAQKKVLDRILDEEY